MDIKLDDILQLKDDELNSSRIELNITAGRGGEWFLDRWLATDLQNRIEGQTECSYWGWYGTKQRNFYPNDLVFSFVKKGGDEWLFVSAAKILDVPFGQRASYEILEKYRPFFGRLIISYKKKQTYSRYVFKLRSRLKDITVKEILPDLYNGSHFPGYDQVCLSFKELEGIVRRRPADWINALEHQKAVYLITDKSNGRLYVGSATADSKMLLSRWESYVSNGHGGNIELKKIVDSKGFDYIKQNFQYSIIENYNAKIDDEYIRSREVFWKRILQSEKHGYNKNY